MNKIKFFPSILLIILLRIYRLFISPILGASCRKEPSCSAYAILALQRHSLLYSFFLIIKRVLTCNPWCKGGYDPVPESKNKRELK